MTIICERCQATNPAGFRFCGSCGAPMPDNDSAELARKVVTVLFADIAGSTALGEQLDPEALRDALGRFFDDAHAIVARHGGTVQKFAGDAVLAVFGIPRVHEDDALRAVRAAVEIRQKLPELAEEIGLDLNIRTGINTGLVMTDPGRTLVLGDAVNVAARLQTAAAPAEILLGEATVQLVRDAVTLDTLEPLALKGKVHPVPAYRVVSISAHARGVARRMDQPLVGREREIGVMHEAWSRVLAERRCHTLTLLGVPGLGKSRVAEELCRSVSHEASVLRGRCLPYGEGITFWPLIEAFGAAGQAAQDTVRHLLQGSGTAEEMFLTVRLKLEGLARRRPVILYVDDLQWAEPMLIDLLDYVVELSEDAQLLLLCTARPELGETYPRWARPGPGSTVIDIEPLPEPYCRRLVESAGSVLDEQARSDILRISEGNPLFIEEMVALSMERGSVQLPPTIQSLLAARIEALVPAERDVLACGAVEGEVFHRSAVSVLTGADDEDFGTTLEGHLESLRRKDFIRPHRAMLPGDQAFRFRHVLIRDSAYERVPRARRAELHERLAGWLSQNAGVVPEHEELIGWHLERVVREQEQIRRPVPGDIRLTAAGHLHAAARHASDRGDISASRKLLERAVALTPPQETLRIALTADLAERLLAIGDLSGADELLGEAERTGGGEPILSLRRLEWLSQARPDEAARLYDSGHREMDLELARSGNAAGLAGLHMVGFWVHWLRSQATAAGTQVRRAADHAAASGDLALRSRALGWYVVTLIYGPASASEIATELRSIERDHPGPYLRAFLLMGHAEVDRLRGRFEEAVRQGVESLESFRGLGLPILGGAVMQLIARIDLAAGNPASARDWLVRSDAVLGEAGERNLRSTTLAELATVHALLGSAEEARRAATRAEELSSPQDVLNFILIYEARARLALAEGADEEAERCAQRALSHANRTEFTIHTAHAHLIVARVLLERGRPEPAAEQAGFARALFLAKEDLPGVAAADALASLPPGGARA